MKKFLGIVLMMFTCNILGQNVVTQEQMQKVYEEVKTPYKYGMVIVPSDNSHKIDCPTVFRYNDKWYMTYVIYDGKGAKDGRGYETWLSESDDLLHWNTLGRVLSFRDGTWDMCQRGGFPALADMQWGGSYELQPYKGKYWMTYIGGKGPGYEAISAPLNIGLAWTDEESLPFAHEWNSKKTPILSIDDKDVQWWEKLTQYKSTVYWDKDELLGKPFVMFYNAGGIHPTTGVKGERVGIALSSDMKKWKRYNGNPVFAHESAGTITGDAHIQKMGDLYVMFYFSAFNPSRQYKAFNTFACSYDLVNWYDWKGEDLIVPSKEYDNLFAHKSYVIKHNGVVYHFYCAVNEYEQRGIAVATSKRMGISDKKFPKPETKNRRLEIELKDNWETCLEGSPSDKKLVSVPHNWDDYYGYRQLTHGNLHGNAYYKTSFMAPSMDDKAYFLRFEGVGTYADVVLNGKSLGRHPVGRTTLTLDVTSAVKIGASNVLELKVEYPEMITDMPWVCGGCSSEWGFSEGSQPFGIFRPVVLEVTDKSRIEPFGVHIWHDDELKTVFINTELKNYGSNVETLEFVNKFSNADGRQVFRLSEKVSLKPGEVKVIRQSAKIDNPILWSVDRPYLYKLATMLKRNGKTVEEVSTPFGIRSLSWPVKRNDNDGRFMLNGKPVFLNGVCEYEHQFGASHAFSKEQVAARVKEIRSAGFNAVRDAHQPHHLDYQQAWDKYGIIFWPQFSAHIWYDTPEFRENFKKLLRQWIKERRNSPSVVMWGLQNESTLPKEFAQECCDIIREMDPTAVNMRIITTCNGGEGSDWNVIQNWSGTYGGNLYNYNKELASKKQLLNGEYGAWRTLGLHSEPSEFNVNGAWTEERMCQLMETKIRLAEQVKDSVCGHFQWIFTSHDNPGRRQPDEAYRKIDKVGPFNYKGLMTPWEEPLDVYYMYKANYVPASKDPFVYISSHTWPDRFSAGSRRANIEVYSNCDSVILYNDMSSNKNLGVKKNHGLGTHFLWENRLIKYNVLRAVGYWKGNPVAEDILVYKGLGKAPNFDRLYDDDNSILKAEEGYKYLYRINCGGDNFTDSFGQVWMQDNMNYSSSWSEHFEGLNPYLASQRTVSDPIKGTKDWTLFQTFRFGRHKLKYRLPLPDGKYRLELYFVEPWHGTGGGYKTDCEGLRIFDVEANGELIFDDLDIWAEVGHDAALRKVTEVEVRGGVLEITFPEVKAGQAIISGIAVATLEDKMVPVYKVDNTLNWKSFDTDTIAKTPTDMLPVDDNQRTTVVYEAEDAIVSGKCERRLFKKQTGVFFIDKKTNSIEWTVQTGLAQIYALRFKFMNTSGKSLPVHFQFIDSKGIVLKEDTLNFPVTPDKWKMMSTTTGSYINAGKYTVRLSADSMLNFAVDALEIQ